MEDITMLFLNRRTLLVGVSFFIFTNAVLSSAAHAASSSGEFGRDAAAIRWGGAESLAPTYPLEAFPCTKTYVNGRVTKSMSCTDCCGLDDYADDSGSCISSCYCEFEEEQEGTRTVVDNVYPYLVRGVPVLFQYDAKPAKTKKYPIGCGPVAVSSLFLWYHSLGWTNLADDYENSSGEIAWDEMVEDMADYLDTWVRKNASPTFTKKMQSGIEDYLDDSSYSADVSHYEVTDDEDETDEAFERIKSSILQGRPVVLGYDTDEDEGGGIGGGGDDLGFIDHYGLITGYDDSVSPPQIYVNTGWGAGSSGNTSGSSYDWVIGSGQVHLWFVQLTAGEKDVGSEVCATENWDSIYDPLSIPDLKDGGTDYIGVMYKSSTYDSYPMVNRLISGAECGVIGGEETHEESYTYTEEWVEELSCQRKYSTYDDVIDGSWEPETKDVGGIGDRE
jgi:hypothetical protein